MTGLTVPRAGTHPGRAARAATVPVNRAGAVVAEFGQDADEVGAVILKDQLDRQMRRLQVDMNRDLNDLRLQTMQIGNPDAADSAWISGLASLRERYAQPDEHGRPGIHPKNRENFDIAFKSLANRHAFGIGQRNIELGNAERQATFMAYSHEAARTYASGDDKMRAQTLADMDAAIDADVAAGRIDAAQGQARKMEFRKQGDNARAIRMIGEDPRAYQAASANGEFDHLPEETRARYDAQASGAAARADEAASKAAEKLANEQTKAIGARLSEIRQIAGDGFQAVDEEFMARPEVQAHPDYGQTMAEIALRDEGIAIATASPEQIEAALATEKSRKVAKPWQTQRAGVLEAALEQHRDGYAKDMIGYAQQQGLDVPALPEFDPADPMAFGQALSDRVVWAGQMVAAGYGDTPRYFSNAEREKMRAMASVDADPATRAELAQTMAVSLTGASPDAVASFGFDPVFSYVGEMEIATGNRELGAEVFRGQQAIKEKNVILPPVKDRLNPTFDAVRGFFAAQPGGQAKQAEVIAAADALYAARMQSTGPADDIDESIYRQALHEVMGGTGGYNSRDAQGGMQDVNGQLTPLPVGIGARQIDRAVFNLRRDLKGVGQAANPDALEQAMNIAATGAPAVRPITRLDAAQVRARADARLQAASISGGQPGINGEPLDADELADMQITPAGNGVYVMSIDGVAVHDLQTGGLWRFDLSRLVREYSE